MIAPMTGEDRARDELLEALREARAAFRRLEREFTLDVLTIDCIGGLLSRHEITVEKAWAMIARTWPEAVSGGAQRRSASDASAASVAPPMSLTTDPRSARASAGAPFEAREDSPDLRVVLRTSASHTGGGQSALPPDGRIGAHQDVSGGAQRRSASDASAASVAPERQ